MFVIISISYKYFCETNIGQGLPFVKDFDVLDTDRDCNPKLNEIYSRINPAWIVEQVHTNMIKVSKKWTLESNHWGQDDDIVRI